MKIWGKLLLILVFMCCNLQAATVYKKVDENGNLIFSDTPMEDAETLDVPPVPTLKLNNQPPKFVPSKKKKEPFAYTDVKITAPKADETFVNNQGTVTITVQVSPGLRPKDQLQLLLNGVKRAGPASSSSFSFSNLERGSYAASAQVVDQQGKVIISSPSISFHIKRSFARN